MMENRNKIILTTLVCLIPTMTGLILWNQLPAQMPIHFTFAGEIDGWGSKVFVVIGLPLMLSAMHLFLVFLTSNDPKKQNIGNRMISLTYWSIPMICCMFLGLIFAISLGFSTLDPVMWINVLIGVFFIVMGNYMTKNHQNYTVGIRLPWTLESRENWNRTHRLASRLWILSGLILLINGMIRSQWMMLPVIVISTVIPMVYSFILYRKGI